MTTPLRCAHSLKALLAGLVDYAGLFPPAGLAMRPAADNFAAYLRDESSWGLGRFVCPATRLTELEGCLTSASTAHPWRISVLLGNDLGREIDLARAFNGRLAGRAVADAIEFKAETPEAIRHAGDLIPDTMSAYCEIPAANDPRELLAAISAAGLRAKIRTGAVTAAGFPTSAQVARFVARCAEASVPFKATAGLHHPLRGEYRLTYEPDSPSAIMHGFLNVFMAAAFAHTGWGADQLTPLLEETEGGAFEFTDAGATWRGHRLATDDIHKTRSQFAMAFGSCSFEEPIHDLKALELL